LSSIERYGASVSYVPSLSEILRSRCGFSSPGEQDEKRVDAELTFVKCGIRWTYVKQASKPSLTHSLTHSLAHECSFTEVDESTNLKLLLPTLHSVVLVIPLTHSADPLPSGTRLPTSCILSSLELVSSIAATGLVSPATGIFVLCTKQDLYDDFSESHSFRHPQHPLVQAQFPASTSLRSLSLSHHALPSWR